MRKEGQTALKKLEEQDIIEKVPENEGIPWVSPTVVPKKDGEVRIFADLRLANEAIQRRRHSIPTVDDVRFELNGANSSQNWTRLRPTNSWSLMKLVVQ